MLKWYSHAKYSKSKNYLSRSSTHKCDNFFKEPANEFLQTLLFYFLCHERFTHPKNKFNANNWTICVWMYLMCWEIYCWAERCVEWAEKRKSFKNIISWLLLFRVKTISSLILHCLVSRNAGKNMNEDFSSSFLLDFVETTTTTSEWKKNGKEGEKKIWIWYNLHNRTSAHEILKGQFTFSSCKQQMLSLSFLFLASIHPLYFFVVVVYLIRCWRRKSFTLEIPLIDQQSHLSPQKKILKIIPRINSSHPTTLYPFPFFRLSLLAFRWRQLLWNCEIERQRHREILMFSFPIEFFFP